MEGLEPVSIRRGPETRDLLEALESLRERWLMGTPMEVHAEFRTQLGEMARTRLNELLSAGRGSSRHVEFVLRKWNEVAPPPPDQRVLFS